MRDKFDLSRRKILAGLGTIGVAGAGAGAGTTALFSDEETFQDNSITAGTMDLSVELELLDINPQTQANGLNTSASDLNDAGDTVTVNGDESTDIEGGQTADFDLVFDDVKPGDWWVLQWTVSIDGNPGYVGYRANDVSQGEGDTPEPETTETTSDPGEGDLGTELRVRAGDSYDDSAGAGIQSGTAAAKDVQQGDTGSGSRAYSTPKDISLDGDGGIRFGGQIADSSSAPFAANPLDLFFVGTLNHKLWSVTSDLGNSYFDPDLNQDIEDLDYAEAYTFVNPVGDQNGDGTVDGSDGGQSGVNHSNTGPGLGSIRNSNDYTTLGTQNSPDANSVSFVEKYFIPKEVGNVIQGDTVSFEVEFLAEQARNNGSPSWLARDSDPDVSDT